MDAFYEKQLPMLTFSLLTSFQIVCNGVAYGWSRPHVLFSSQHDGEIGGYNTSLKVHVHWGF
jgi:hypothetical protein